MSKNLEEVLADRSTEELIKTISSIDIMYLSKLALITNDEALLDYTDRYIYGNEYNRNAICRCTDAKMLTKVLDKMSNERAYRLFDTNATNHHNNMLFMMLIKKIPTSILMIEDLVYGSYSFGLKYCMRNFPLAMNHVRNNTRLFEDVIIEECYSVLDIFYVHCDINNIDLEDIVPYSINSKTFNRMIEYGYNLVERFLVLEPEIKEKMPTETYLYFHNRGLYYNRDIMQKITGASSKRTYRYIPEEDKPLCSPVFLSRANYMKRVKYADRLLANKATDITIVCSYD